MRYLHPRGTTQQNDGYTGEDGEITVDQERHELRLHDGTTLGGHPLESVAQHTAATDPHPQYAQAIGFKRIEVVTVGGIPDPAEPDTLYIEVL